MPQRKIANRAKGGWHFLERWVAPFGMMLFEMRLASHRGNAAIKPHTGGTAVPRAKDSKPRKRWVALFGKVGGTFWNDAIWDDRGIAVWSMLPYMGQNSCHSE